MLGSEIRIGMEVYVSKPGQQIPHSDTLAKRLKAKYWEDGRDILGFKEGDSLDMPIRGHAYNVYAISTDKGVALIDGDNCSFLVRIKGLERTSENKVEKESDIKVEYKHDKPYGIRDKTGYLLFFRSIDKYEGQEERYKEEVEEMKSLAEDISKYLKVRHSQA